MTALNDVSGIQLPLSRCFNGATGDKFLAAPVEGNYKRD